MASSNDPSDNTAAAGDCGEVPNADLVDCKSKRGNPNASASAPIGPGGGILTLTPAQGATWQYILKFFRDPNRPQQAYTLTEQDSAYPDVGIDPPVSLALNCNSKSCWKFHVPSHGCGRLGGRRFRLYVCDGSQWLELQDALFDPNEDPADPQLQDDEDPPPGVFAEEPPLGARARPPFTGGTRMAMGAE